MWLAFAVFLSWRSPPPASCRAQPARLRVGGHDDGKSIFAAAKAATYNSIPFAFMWTRGRCSIRLGGPAAQAG